ncbi:glycerate kinase [Limosilactobacillus fermentum]
MGDRALGLYQRHHAKGIELVVEYSQLEEQAAGADYVLTGEGSIDFQTKFGKTPYGVAKTTKRVAPKRR